MIGEGGLSRPAERPAVGVQIGIRSGTLGGYVILGLLALIYLIPLLFVLFVSLMSSRQFALNAGGENPHVLAFVVPLLYSLGHCWDGLPDMIGTPPPIVMR